VHGHCRLLFKADVVCWLSVTMTAEGPTSDGPLKWPDSKHRIANSYENERISERLRFGEYSPSLRSKCMPIVAVVYIPVGLGSECC